MKIKRILIYIFLLLIIVAGIGAYFAYQAIYKDNVNNQKDKYEIFIDPNSSVEDFKSELSKNNILINENSFDFVAKLMSFENKKVSPGKYSISSNLSNKALISLIRSGRQSAVNLTFNNAREISDLSGKLSKNILLDSLSILSFLSNNENIAESGFDHKTIMSLFIPNTYKVYWSINEKELLDRMIKEHRLFWNEERSKKAEELGMTKVEVYTLASIVDRESLVKKEKNRIAGVYINRLKRGIPLQADPTVVFALKKFDLRRILNKHLEVDSPYNTYKYAGLPPGPVGMASISGIDAVLDAENHDFIYFCAKPDGKGRHAFAKTLSGHNKNARIYHKWLNSKGIR